MLFLSWGDKNFGYATYVWNVLGAPKSRIFSSTLPYNLPISATNYFLILLPFNKLWLCPAFNQGDSKMLCNWNHRSWYVQKWQNVAKKDLIHFNENTRCWDDRWTIVNDEPINNERSNLQPSDDHQKVAGWIPFWGSEVVFLRIRAWQLFIYHLNIFPSSHTSNI